MSGFYSYPDFPGASYDNWKTTDPRDYEPEPEDEPSELEQAMERADYNAKHYAQASREVSRLRSLIFRMLNGDAAAEQEARGMFEFKPVQLDTELPF